MTITQYVTGKPMPQPRPRAFARGGKARVFDPGTAEHWKSAIAAAMEDHAGKMITGPLSVSMTFYFMRPAIHFGTGKNTHKVKTRAPKFHIQRPDGDNLAKAVCDALTSIGVWRDDSQVVSWSIRKEWAQAEQGMSLMIREMDEDELD